MLSGAIHRIGNNACLPICEQTIQYVFGGEGDVAVNVGNKILYPIIVRAVDVPGQSEICDFHNHFVADETVASGQVSVHVMLNKPNEIFRFVSSMNN